MFTVQCSNLYQNLIFFFPVPYDSNFVALKASAFQGPSETNYVNASRIKFEDLEQTFIACQAPLPCYIDHFWQMVIEEKVEVILLVVIIVIFMALTR